MAEWKAPLPAEAKEGNSGHPEDHNKLNAAVKEIRDLVDSGALNGKDGKGTPGDDGHSPVITFDGTKIVVDGTAGPDLKGKPGDAGKSPKVTMNGTKIVIDGVEGPDLKGAPGDKGKDSDVTKAAFDALAARVTKLETPPTEG
ncbi:hypothetical protein NQ036_03660 [Brevibacterium sp. 91QC2O2]|uniref:hypothetical protein n=1 Tax=Brevibacterium TaxID=1696 RepID=UPI00211C8840|nr:MULTISPECIES: hypothetical protein [unclassified Brevibacterium]MCQ9367343.1 hypothetical protein [Brevibacterium sp. 91QC2O2]MCQ9384644.1 hypothetical protein [Brevibacterium sp. 68QC2CO]